MKAGAVTAHQSLRANGAVNAANQNDNVGIATVLADAATSWTTKQHCVDPLKTLP
jgi:hypothetical protein